MAYIYMDESGDLGFNGKEWASKYFIITFLISKNEKDPEIVMKNVRKWAAWKWALPYWSFFHSYKHWENIVKRILDLLSRRDIFSIAMIAKKENVPFKLKKDIHDLYNMLVFSLLELWFKRWVFQNNEKIFFIASRRETNKNLNLNFIDYLKSKQLNFWNIEYKILSPSQTKWLEVVDAVSFALNQKYEKWNLDIYSVIKNKIILEKQIF